MRRAIRSAAPHFRPDAQNGHSFHGRFVPVRIERNDHYMARIKAASMTRKRRKKVLKLAKGYFGAKSRLFKTANQAVMKSLTNAYKSRKLKKREFRSLWITRISAAAKINGMNYSRFMNGLKRSGINLNRKVLADMACSDAQGFAALAEKAKSALN